MKSVLKNIFIFLTIVIVAQLWQGRNLPSGVAPQVQVTSLKDSSKTLLPAGDGKVELIYFFAPWCGVCKVSAANAGTIAKWFPNVRVRFVGLEYEKEGDVKAFSDQYLQGDDVYIGDEAVRGLWSVSAYPTYALVDKSGKISHMAIGYSPVLGMAIWAMLAQWG